MFLDYCVFYGTLTTISIIASSIIGFLGWGVKKVINTAGKKNDIKISFEDFFTDYIILQNRIMNDLETFYNNNINDMENTVKSRNQEMRGILLNIEKWNKIVEQFEKIKQTIQNELK